METKTTPDRLTQEEAAEMFRRATHRIRGALAQIQKDCASGRAWPEYAKTYLSMADNNAGRAIVQLQNLDHAISEPRIHLALTVLQQFTDSELEALRDNWDVRELVMDGVEVLNGERVL